jgi:predicted histone-like DNA-binding protein
MINYRVSPRANNLKKGETVYTAVLVSDETTDLKWFFKEMKQRSRFTDPDTIKFLMYMSEIIENGLKNNKIVHVPYLGNFRLTAQSSTVKDPKVFNVDNIKELKLQFNPDKSIKKTIQSFPLKKVK